MQLAAAVIKAASADNGDNIGTSKKSTLSNKGSKPSSRASTPPTGAGTSSLMNEVRYSKARVMYNPVLFGLPSVQLKK